MWHLLSLLVAVSFRSVFCLDWLVDKITEPVSLTRSAAPLTINGSLFHLDNGLIRRTFAATPGQGWATWQIHTSTHGAALRAISPEAWVSLDGVEYAIGGLIPLRADGITHCAEPIGVGPAGACPVAYFNRSQLYGPNSSAFVYVGHSTRSPEAPFPWQPGSRHTRADTHWPPQGLQLDVLFTAPQSALAAHRGVTVTVSYELFQGAPLMTKRVTVSSPPEGAQTTAPVAEPEVPPQQSGPVHIGDCDSAVTWLLPSSATSSTNAFGSPIFFRNGSKLSCLSATNGTARHGFNDKVAVLACPADTADPHQLWQYNMTSDLLQCAAFSGCCLDVNNHQTIDGTVCQTAQCTGTWHWKLLNRSSTAAGTLAKLGSVEAAGKCLTYLHQDPPPPPPPPPPPLPVGTVILTGVVVETLRLNQPWAPSDPRPFDPFFGSGTEFDDSGSVIKTRVVSGFLYVHCSQRHGTQVLWTDDPSFDSAYAGNIGANEPVLTVAYQAPNPHAALIPGGVGIASFKAILLYTDTIEQERQGLMRRKMVRILAPQTSEAPLFMHLTDVTPKGIKSAVDQISLVGGFDMIVFSFGSGFNLEDTSAAYLEQMKQSIAYANSKGVEIGGYDLVADTRSGTGYDTIDPSTGVSSGNACFASRWAEVLTDRVMTFLNATGMSMVETDGPYAGQPCASHDHEHHRGAEDSVDIQWRKQALFYANLRKHGVFIHAPDDYLFDGGANKCVLGYAENQFNLGRDEWIAISRQQIFDNTWVQTPTQGWMFAALVDYHGGGDAAALEPLSEHITAWEWTLASFLGAGVGACYRGDRLFDTPEVQQMVSKWTSFWLKYRRILTEDIIHLRRPTVSDMDAIMHVSSVIQHPEDAVAALVMVYNPSDLRISSNLTLPLYYTGITGSVRIAERGGSSVQELMLDREYKVQVEVNLGPKSISYFVITK